MAKLRFIKAWGPNKPGDIKDAASQAFVVGAICARDRARYKQATLPA